MQQRAARKSGCPEKKTREGRWERSVRRRFAMHPGQVRQSMENLAAMTYVSLRRYNATSFALVNKK